MRVSLAGVFGEDVGEAVAAFVVVFEVSGGAVVDADPAGVLAVEGFGFEPALFGQEVGYHASGAGLISLRVGGEPSFVEGAVGVAA